MFPYNWVVKVVKSSLLLSCNTLHRWAATVTCWTVDVWCLYTRKFCSFANRLVCANNKKVNRIRTHFFLSLSGVVSWRYNARVLNQNNKLFIIYSFLILSRWPRMRVEMTCDREIRQLFFLFTSWRLSDMSAYGLIIQITFTCPEVLVVENRKIARWIESFLDRL